MSRVLIADDHAVTRAGYKQFLETDPSITEVGEAASGNETLDVLRREKWDLLLMDIHMPDRSGLDILKHVTSGFPDLRVLIMSGLPEEQYARNVLRGGASDLGGLLLDGRLAPAAGAEAGLVLTLDDVERVARELGRPLWQRTTGYGKVIAGA